MIINASDRTDIPAFYSEWFFNRINAGYVCVRNPYNPKQITRYELNTTAVDSIVFTTKNPKPMLPRLCELAEFHPYFFITITPYGTDIEPSVPSYQQVANDFIEVSKKLGVRSVCWRYDPILINEQYTIEKHIEVFNELACHLDGYTTECVISFIDLYAKTKKNLSGIREVSEKDQIRLAKELSSIAKQHGIQIKTCAEKIDLSEYGIKSSGCITKAIMEEVIGSRLNDIPDKSGRAGCHCIENRDIGSYDSCLHGCRYCYANEDSTRAVLNYQNHNPNSPLLIGELTEQDCVKCTKQESYVDNQLRLL